MLTEILSRETCANCRICCSFDNNDIWETPVISSELRAEILEINPSQKFISKGNSYLFNIEKTDDEELFYCPTLSKEGCILGDKKPFDCKIWPFRIMNFSNHRVIALSPVCPCVIKKPVDELITFLNNGLAETIFAEADKNPNIVKEYMEGYPILATE